jgi:hypothetical protein
MTHKQPYETVLLVVDKLYDKELPPNATNSEIEDYCQFIADTIVSMGWTVDEFNLRYVSEPTELVRERYADALN